MKAAPIAVLVLLMGLTPLAQAPRAILLVVNKTDATLSFIEPGSGATLGTVSTGPNPHEVAASPDGRIAITTNYGGDSLSVIDIAARRELRRVPLPDLRQPHGIEYVGSLAVFTAEGNRAVAAYDSEANRIVWRFPTAQDTTHMVTATRDGQTLFTSNIGSNNITVLERTGESWRTTQVPVGAGPEGLALSPDERELWTAHTRDGAVSVIDVASKKVVARVDARTRLPNRVKFTRDGGQAVISDLNGGELVVVDTRTRMVNRRVRLGSMPEGILIAPAGDRIYVAVTGENRVVALDAKTLNVVQSITTGRGPDGMAWVGR